MLKILICAWCDFTLESYVPSAHLSSRPYTVSYVPYWLDWYMGLPSLIGCHQQPVISHVRLFLIALLTLFSSRLWTATLFRLYEKNNTVHSQLQLSVTAYSYDPESLVVPSFFIIHSYMNKSMLGWLPCSLQHSALGLFG